MINDADLTAILITASCMTIPAAAIVGAYWQKIVKLNQQHREQMARIQALQGAPASEASRTDLQALRQELASLRDTTTQYDLSVEHNISELLRRMQAMETKIGSGATAPASPILDGAVGAPQRAPAEYIAAALLFEQPEEASLRVHTGR